MKKVLFVVGVLLGFACSAQAQCSNGQCSLAPSAYAPVYQSPFPIVTTRVAVPTSQTVIVIRQPRVRVVRHIVIHLGGFGGCSAGGCR